MNENIKSALFVFGAAVVLLIAWASRPSSSTVDDLGDVRDQLLFPEFTNPLDAARLQVVQYDEAKGEKKPFEVAWTQGRWSIPTKNDYPADAKDHMVEAATSVLGLTISDVVSKANADHELYGVVDPNEAKAGAQGVGTRVVMSDKSGKQLLGIVIGKDANEKKEKDFGDKKDFHYVRKLGEEPVYLVKVNPDKLSTNFADWIEKDLLKLSSWDVKTVELMDYSFDPRRMRLDQRGRMVLEYNDTGEPKWKITDDMVVQDSKPAQQKLAADEEVNAKKLDDLKFALGGSEFKIVDVAKKPEGLSGGLKAKGNLRLDEPAIRSLGERGFYLLPVGQDSVELISTEGEVHVGMKDGVRYVLRFGRIAGADGTAKKNAKKEEKKKKEGEKKEEKKDEKKSDTAGLSRYLFVMAEFDAGAIEKPKLETVPPEPKPEAKPAEKEAKPAAKKDEKKDDAKKEEKTDGEKKDDAKKKEEDKTAQAKAERERIDNENKQKQKDYDKKIADGKKRVEDLNARFADWYYVIPDDVYQKVHLGRKDVIQKKEKKEEKKDEHAGHDHGPAAKPDTAAEFKDLTKEIPVKPAAPKPEEGKKTEPMAKPEPQKKPDASTEKKPAEKTKPAPEKKPAAAKKTDPEKKPKPPAEKKPDAEKKPEPAKK